MSDASGILFILEGLYLRHLGNYDVNRPPKAIKQIGINYWPTLTGPVGTLTPQNGVLSPNMIYVRCGEEYCSF